jgi:hypothetical protein
LFNKSERDKLKKAGGKIADLVNAIAKTNEGGIANTYKESQFGRGLDEYFKDRKDLQEILRDDNISDDDKMIVLNQVAREYLISLGYTGKMPLILIGGETTYAIDGTHGSEVIFIRPEDVNNPDILKILGHELGHLNDYDTGEATADNVGGKINVSVAPTNTNGKYDDYLAALRPFYEGFLTVDEVGKLSAVIPDDWKEEWGVKVGIYANGSFIASGTAGLTLYVLWDSDKKKFNISLNTEVGAGGTTNIEASIGILAGYTKANTVEDTEEKSIYSGFDVNIPALSDGGTITHDKGGKINGGVSSGKSLSEDVKKDGKKFVDIAGKDISDKYYQNQDTYNTYMGN